MYALFISNSESFKAEPQFRFRCRLAYPHTSLPFFTVACPIAVRRCRRPPATCVPGTRPASQFEPRRVALSTRPSTDAPGRPLRCVRIAPRACLTRPGSKNRTHERERRTVAHAAPVHAAPHTPSGQLTAQPRSNPCVVVRLPRPRLARAPALACRCRRRR